MFAQGFFFVRLRLGISVEVAVDRIFFYYPWAAREGNAQSLNGGQLVCAAKRQKGGRNSQKALRCPIPLQWGRFLWRGDGSFQVIWRTDLEVDLERTQNYCVKLLSLYLRRIII